MGIFKKDDTKERIEQKKAEEAKRIEKVFTERLELVLMERDLTKKAFAKSIGIAPNTLSGYVTGTHMPDMVTFDIICRQLEVSADYLLGRTDNPCVETKRTRRENELLSFYRLISSKYQDEVIGEVKGIARMENRLDRK